MSVKIERIGSSFVKEISYILANEIKDKDINLRYDYDDIININGNIYRVNDYLYSLTTDEVREYFGIPYKGNRIKRKTKVS